MKKLLTFSVALALVLAFSAMSFAQDNYNQGYGNYTGLTGIGIKAGADASRTYGSDSRVTAPGVPPITGTGPTWQFKGGFIGGAFIKYNVTELFAIQPEALYAMYGSRRNVDFAGQTNFRTLFNYVEIPVLLMYSPSTTSNVMPEIFVGPTVDFLVQARQKSDNIGGGTNSLNVKDQLHSTLFGATFGAGLAYPMSMGKITLDARYNLGITKVYKSTPVAGFSQPNLRNSAVALMLGFSFK